MEAMPERNSHYSEDATPKMDDPGVVEDNTPSQLIFKGAATEGGIQEELNQAQVQESHGAAGIEDKEHQSLCCPECAILKGKGVHCDAAVDWAVLLGQTPASHGACCSPQLRARRPGVSREVAKAHADSLLFHKLQALRHAIRQKAVYVNTLHITAQRCFRAWEAVPHTGVGEDGGPEKAAALQTYDAAWLETDDQVDHLNHMREVLGVMEKDATRIAATMEDALVGGWACEACFDISSFIVAD